MQISSHMPLNVARAYGLKPPTAAGPVAPANAATPASPARPLASTPTASSVAGPRVASSIQEATAMVGAKRSPLIDRIVGATVNQPIEFDGAATRQPGATLPLYTRAADKLEAAVAINVGRAIDITG